MSPTRSSRRCSVQTRLRIIAIVVVVFSFAGMVSHPAPSLGALSQLGSEHPSRLVDYSVDRPVPEGGPQAGLAPRPLASGSAFWTNLSGPVGPSFRAIAPITYDWADHEDILFGGLGTGGPLNDTWTYANGSWTNITSTAGNAPPAQYGMAMTYDFGDGYVLTWGCPGPSPNTSSFCNDTWSFVHGKWSKINATVHTPTGQSSTELIPWDVPYTNMVYDAADGYVLLTDGPVTVSYSGGVWRPFCADGGTNCTRSIPGPPEAGIAYDASDGYVVSFGGGLGPSGQAPGDYTWKFSAGTWTNITSMAGSPPAPRFTTSMIYDNTTESVLLFGGDNQLGHALNDTWTFQGGTWNNLSASPAPQARYEGSLGYDGSDGGAVLFGGIGGTETNTTWFWGTTPPLADLAITANDTTPLPGNPVTFGELLRGGSGSLSYGWRFGDGGTSTDAEPIHVFSANGYYTIHLWVNDSYGAGVSATATIHVSTPLSVTSIAASQNPAALGVPVNFTVVAAGGAPPYTYSWEFGDGGTGGNLSSITHVYTTDGPFQVSVSVGDASGAVARRSINVSIGLQAVAGSSTSSGTSPLTVSFLGQAHGGYPPYRYSWLFGDGASSGLQDPSHTYNASGHYEVVLLATDSRGNVSSSSLSIDVGSPGVLPSTRGGGSTNEWYYAFVVALASAIAIAAVWSGFALRERSRRIQGERWIRELTSNGIGGVDSNRRS
jgi:PKD repeat protein